MTEYVAFDPSSEVSGQAAQSMIEALGNDALGILQDHNVYPIDPNKWYRVQSMLDAYKKLNADNMFNMVAVGMKIPDIAPWPPIETIEEALKLLNEAYQMNHRNGDIGEYRFEKTGERSGSMMCRNPYPSDLDYGIVYRLVQKYRPADSVDFLVELDPNAPARRNGADSCTFLVSW